MGYVLCEIRQQSSEEPCDETSFGKKILKRLESNILSSKPLTVYGQRVRRISQHGAVQILVALTKFGRSNTLVVRVAEAWYLGGIRKKHI